MSKGGGLYKVIVFPSERCLKTVNKFGLYVIKDFLNSLSYVKFEMNEASVYLDTMFNPTQ